jgi:hypothetical protein
MQKALSMLAHKPIKTKVPATGRPGVFFYKYPESFFCHLTSMRQQLLTM